MSLTNFEILTKLGEGSYSTVYKVKRLSDNQIYALKKVRLNSLKEKEKRNALNEIRILASLNHNCIISYKEAFFDENSNSLCLVMEYADNGDLYQRIIQYQKKGVYMSEPFIWNLLICVAKGLKALHDLNILHRDLKSANIFLTNSGEVKLGDMNVSKISKDCAMHTQTGTPYYASPEVWKDIPYDNKSDMWSLGCVIYEAAALKPPFRAENMEGLYKKVVKGEFSNIPKGFSADLQTVISGLLQVNPGSRLSCSQVLALPAVMRHLNGDCEAIESSLLQTIKFPKDFNNISKELPLPNYKEKIKENRQLRNKSMRIVTFRKKVTISRERNQAKQRAASRHLIDVSSIKKKFQRDAKSVIKLPQVSFINKKLSAKLIQAVDKNDQMPRIPVSNRCYLYKAVN